MVPRFDKKTRQGAQVAVLSIIRSLNVSSEIASKIVSTVEENRGSTQFRLCIDGVLCDYSSHVHRTSKM